MADDNGVSDIMAGLAKLDAGEEVDGIKPDVQKPVAPKKEPEAKLKIVDKEIDDADKAEDEAAADKPDGEGADDDKEDAEEEGDKDEDDEDGDGEDEDGDGDKDEDADLPSKNLDALHRRKRKQDETHRRAMAEVAHERGEIDRAKAAFESERAKDANERRELGLLKARAKGSPRAAVMLLRQLGVTPAQFGTVANIAYAMSDTADEKWKRQWGADDGTVNLEQEELRRTVDELKSKLDERDGQEKQLQTRRQQEAAVSGYVDEISKAVKADSHSLMAHALQKNPDRAKGKIRAVLQYLANESGGIPSPKKVADTAERLLREEIEMYGVAAPITKPKDEAAKNKSAKPDLAKPKTADAKKPNGEKKEKTLLEELDELDRVDRSSS